MTEAEVKRIVSEAVTETLTRLGIDADDPIEFQKDMAHVRSWRQAKETVVKQGLITAIGIVTAGILGLIWLAITGKGT